MKRWVVSGSMFLCLWVTPAVAQTPIATEEFSVDSFYPAPGTAAYFGVDGARVRGHLATSLHLWTDYAHRPFVLETQCDYRTELDCGSLGRFIDITRSMVTTELLGSISLWNRVQLGLGVPLVYARGQDFSFVEDGTPNFDVPGGSAVALGDIRLHVKVHLVDLLEDLIHFGVVVQGFVPTGQLTSDGHYIGESGFSGDGHVVAEITADRWSGALNLGALYRGSNTLVANNTATQMTYAGAVSFAVTPYFHVLGEVRGQTRFGEPDEKLELTAGLRYRWQRLEFSLGGGMALVRGPGAARGRVVFGVGYSTEIETDADHDGIPDNDDGCPDVAEDMDGWADQDGCPEADNDGDGFDDAVDQCPDREEDFDHFEDEDGCPDLDNDGDGVSDGYDSCPDVAEDMDGDRDQDGCPEQDRDRDGVEDDVDQCPDEPEDTDGFADTDGCPEVDVDGDGIPDDEDECPEEPEDLDHHQDQDGCPE